MQGFQSLLYYVFIVEKTHRVDEVAAAMGIKAGTLYSYIEDKRTFPPDRIAALYRTTRDRRFLALLLDPCDVVFHDAPRCGDTPTREVLTEAIRAQRECVDVLELTHEALGDGRITAEELHNIRTEVSEAHSALAMLCACVTAAYQQGRR